MKRRTEEELRGRRLEQAAQGAPTTRGEPARQLAAWRRFVDARDALLDPVEPAPAAAGETFFSTDGGPSSRVV